MLVRGRAPGRYSSERDQMYLIKKEVDLGEFLTDLAHELFNIVKGLTKNKKT